MGRLNKDAVTPQSGRQRMTDRPAPFKCRKKQEGDEYVCWFCNALRWGVDEAIPENAKCSRELKND